jgi:hypothetical protein
MGDYIKEVRIVRALVDTGVTMKHQLYEEYFDNPGYFYNHSSDFNEPDGIGLPFTAFNTSDWLKSNKIEVIKTIHFKKSRWWKVMEKKYELSLAHLKAERNSIINQIEVLEEWLNDPTYEQQKRSQEIANRER